MKDFVSKVDEANKLDQFFNVLYSFKFFLSLVIFTKIDRDKIKVGQIWIETK